jgi:AraC family ethanolamine operon transcriptional activator
VTFLVPVGAGAGVRLQGRPAAAGTVAVLFDGDELDYRSSGRARVVSISVERAVLDGHVRALLGRQLGELRLEGRLSGLRTNPGLLVRFVRDLAARAAADPHLLRDCDLAAGLERKVTSILFARFEAPGTPETPCRGRAVARRAAAWLRENLAEPPTIADLCEVVNVSERTLHAAFRESLGTTPKAYLKALRLNSAHHDLLRAGSGTRVTDVALDWGFVHFGWFSQDYRRLFGETPSQTLQRARAEAARRGAGAPGPRTPTPVSAPVSSAYAI